MIGVAHVGHLASEFHVSPLVDCNDQEARNHVIATGNPFVRLGLHYAFSCMRVFTSVFMVLRLVHCFNLYFHCAFLHVTKSAPCKSYK